MGDDGKYMWAYENHMWITSEQIGISCERKESFLFKCIQLKAFTQEETHWGGELEHRLRAIQLIEGVTLQAFYMNNEKQTHT